VPDVSATDAARNFSDLLDGVEHRGEEYTIVRRGRAVAHLEPIVRGRGSDLKDLLRNTQPDPSWIDDLAVVRGLVEIDRRA
jgi:prevent-host-death family protein